MEEHCSLATGRAYNAMTEKYWAKVYRTPGKIFKFRAEIYENDQIDDTMSIAKQINKKKFITAYRAKTWAEKTIVNFEQSFFIKDYEIIRRNWNG